MISSVAIGEEGTHFLHVFPHIALAVRTPQEEGGMERRDELRAAAEIVDAAAQPRDRCVGLEQRLGREGTKRHDHARLDEIDLPVEKRLTRRDFVRLRIAILRRAALEDVGDVDVAPLELNRLDDLREQLTGASNERLAQTIFI